ncbi:MAG: hypothetical protein ABFR02_07590 [Campylobacterota bacterium]
MKQYVTVVLIAFHLMGSSLYAAKTSLETEYVHDSIDRYATHQHHHSHGGSSHQHKHSHSQTNINFADFFAYTHSMDLFGFSSPKQTYLETVSWIPNPLLESLFRPPKI